MNVPRNTGWKALYSRANFACPHPNLIDLEMSE